MMLMFAFEKIKQFGVNVDFVVSRHAIILG